MLTALLSFQCDVSLNVNNVRLGFSNKPQEYTVRGCQFRNIDIDVDKTTFSGLAQPYASGLFTST